jgi:hypothetical protein
MKRLGEFRKPHVGLFEYNGEDLLDRARHLGLVATDTWQAIHLREPDGRHHHILRHYAIGTTHGVMAAASREDGIYFDPRKADYFRGGTVRRFLNADGDLCLYGSSGMYVGADGVFVESDGVKSDIVVGAKRLSIKDSGLLELEGELMGPGGWVMLPWAAGKPDITMHAALYYDVWGTAYGKPVRGIVSFENLYNPPGTVWGDSPVAKHYVGTYCAFANRFEDGSVQNGQIANWTSAGAFANIWDDGRHIDAEVLATRVFYRPDGFAGRIEYDLDNGETWECVTEKNGAAIDTWKVAQSIGQTYRTGHKGHVGRVGETRKRQSWYGVFEVFPDRLPGYAEQTREAPGEA